jgi:hypothetical protein
MNQAQIHLALNHASFFLSVLAGLVLIIGLWKKNELVNTIALCGLVAAGLFILPAYFSGEGAEELVEKLPGVNENAVGEHEDFALISLVIIAITGVIALIALVISKTAAIRSWLFRGLVVLSFASFAVIGWTIHLGGMIHHSELGNAATVKEGGGEKDDD